MTSRLVLLLAYLAFIVYGSLVPLDYRPLPWDEAWARWQAVPFLTLGVASRADWIANGVLYLPLGVLAAQVLAQGLGRWAGLPLAWLACLAVAAAVEFAQLFFPPRTVSQNDLLAEGIGAALGVLVAPFADGWARRLASLAHRQRARWLLGLLQLYAALYLALALFPYDLLLSASEWADKLRGGNVAWGLITDRGWGLALLRLAAEAAIAAPLGLLLAALAGCSGRRGFALGAAAGGLLGVLVEAGQLALASGVSQGASVVARGLGVAAGAAILVPLARSGLPGVRRAVARWGPWALPAYLPLLLFASGWMRGAWQGPQAALATFESLRWVPFYYHYYTSEAVALYSLGMVVLMYAPLAVLAWARGWRCGAAVAALLALAVVVETGKLFVAGQRPDPTNLLIVAAAAWVVWEGLQVLSAPGASTASARGVAPRGQGTPAPQMADPAAAPTATAPLSAAAAGVLASLLGIAVATGVTLMPAGAVLLASGLAALAVAAWWRPTWAVVATVAAMPMLDLAPWTGPRWWNEFDLLLLTVLGTAALRLARSPLPVASTRSHSLTVFLPWTLALLVSAAVTLATVEAWSWPGHTPWHAGWTALALLKAAAWAWAFVALLRRLDLAGLDGFDALARGMCWGLAGTVLWVLWERQVFVGFLDFSADYRVTGPLSAMHRGGGFIGCYLAVASAFAAHGLLRAPGWAGRAAGAVLLAGAAYAMAVTYARNGYAAFALVLGLVLLVHGRAAVANRAPAMGRPRLASAVVAFVALLLATAAALPVFSAGFAGERMATAGRDLQLRLAHWRDAVAMRTPGLVPSLLGEGLGRYPELHFWRSGEPVRAASFQRLVDSSGPFLRLGPGATLYVEQIVHLPPDGPLKLALALRARDAAPALAVTLCEKSMLTSRRCLSGRAVAEGAAARDGWQPATLTWSGIALDTTGPPRGPSLKLSLLTPAGPGTVDVARVQLRGPDGAPLLANGDFAQGMQRWSWATDVATPWHVDNVPVHVWLEQGWLGVLGWGALVLSAVLGGAALVWRAAARVPAAWPAACGFLAFGLLNTLVDEPRFLWLLLVLLWLAAWPARAAPSPAAAAPAPLPARGSADTAGAGRGAA